MIDGYYLNKPAGDNVAYWLSYADTLLQDYIKVSIDRDVCYDSLRVMNEEKIITDTLLNAYRGGNEAITSIMLTSKENSRKAIAHKKISGEMEAKAKRYKKKSFNKGLIIIAETLVIGGLTYWIIK